MFCPASAYASLEGGDGMGAGKLKTKRYKVRRGGRGVMAGLIALMALVALATAAYFGLLPLPDLQWALPPSPTLTPQDSAAETRLLTLPGGAWYALQLGAFDDSAAAQSLAESYRGRGAGGLIWQTDRYRVLAAAYETRADAQAVQSQLKAQHGVETAVTDIVWPEITLKLTGQKAQLDALSDAYDALQKLTAHLFALSQVLDRGGADREAVLSALQSERDTVSALQSRLQALFSMDAHPAVRDVIDLLGEAMKALDTALAATGDTRLGARVKYGQLLCVCRLAAHQQGLAP